MALMALTNIIKNLMIKVGYNLLNWESQRCDVNKKEKCHDTITRASSAPRQTLRIQTEAIRRRDETRRLKEPDKRERRERTKFIFVGSNRLNVLNKLKTFTKSPFIGERSKEASAKNIRGLENSSRPLVETLLGICHIQYSYCTGICTRAQSTKDIHVVYLPFPQSSSVDSASLTIRYFQPAAVLKPRIYTSPIPRYTAVLIPRDLWAKHEDDPPSNHLNCRVCTGTRAWGLVRLGIIAVLTAAKRILSGSSSYRLLPYINIVFVIDRKNIKLQRLETKQTDKDSSKVEYNTMGKRFLGQSLGYTAGAHVTFKRSKQNCTTIPLTIQFAEIFPCKIENIQFRLKASNLSETEKPSRQIRNSSFGRNETEPKKIPKLRLKPTEGRSRDAIHEMGSASLNTFERHSECEAQSHACSRGGQLIKGIKRAEPSVFAFAISQQVWYVVSPAIGYATNPANERKGSRMERKVYPWPSQTHVDATTTINQMLVKPNPEPALGLNDKNSRNSEISSLKARNVFTCKAWKSHSISITGYNLTYEVLFAYLPLLKVKKTGRFQSSQQTLSHKVVVLYNREYFFTFQASMSEWNTVWTMVLLSEMNNCRSDQKNTRRGGDTTAKKTCRSFVKICSTLKLIRKRTNDRIHKHDNISKIDYVCTMPLRNQRKSKSRSYGLSLHLKPITLQLSPIALKVSRASRRDSASVLQMFDVKKVSKRSLRNQRRSNPGSNEKRGQSKDRGVTKRQMGNGNGRLDGNL
ncbi:hypothetical protein WN51_10770 [Melipona quadrifasciata]|uniref:Uncharacterized protein n=1 Tax=Melipona quadrifasciata TaxID=166423 RepID=A0A0N0BI48_9HYME|nr:hypothetical protein WN51_10770 [Melipona quadrifasciata]